MIKADELESGLGQFIGTLQYHASSFGTLNLTDGVHFLREQAECYWLIDIIESYNMTDKKVKATEFQVWAIKVNKEDNTAVVTCKDDDGKKLVSQKIEYTDFPLSEFELWCIGGVLLLKSEY